MTIATKTVLAAIQDGDLDNDLDRIKRAVDGRVKRLGDRAARAFALTIEVGDRVQIRADAPIRPKYLLERPIVVRKVNPKTIAGDIENPGTLPSQRYAQGIRVPMEHLERVEGESQVVGGATVTELPIHPDRRSLQDRL